MADTKTYTANDTISRMESRKMQAVEQQINTRYLKIVRKELTECFKREGVNHVDNCADLVEAYWAALGKKPAGPPKEE